MKEEYIKDFDGWNNIKKELDKRTVDFTCYERQIWWCSVGVNIGSEEDGKNKLFERPVLILKKFNATIFLILSITSKNHDHPYYFQLEFDGAIRSVILSQIKLASVKRFHRCIGKISTYDFALIQGKVIDLLRYR
jgi:mRNA-degrading endonuclease toxin of MazEF toxin-antitoxin module